MAVESRVDRLREAGPVLELEQADSRVSQGDDEIAHPLQLIEVVVQQHDFELAP